MQWMRLDNLVCLDTSIIWRRPSWSLGSVHISLVGAEVVVALAIILLLWVTTLATDTPMLASVVHVARLMRIEADRR